MAVLNSLISRAQAADARLVFPEGQDPRVIEAAQMVVSEKVARVTVIGTEEEIQAGVKETGIGTPLFDTVDHHKSGRGGEFAQKLREIRAERDAGRDPRLLDEVYAKMMQDRLYYANMMTRLGEADGLVAGSIASTPDMLRASFKIIGTAAGIATGSSCFVMDLKEPTPAGDETLLYADCGVNPDPDAQALRDIALSTAKTYRSLMEDTPRIAFLSFSTKGSAQHESLEKIREAAELTAQAAAKSDLEIVCDGELQADAALVPAVAGKKCPDSSLAGRANILIFPDLNAGNIAYKLTQRLAGADAYGPVLQGLARPVNDLSRGCSARDIFGVAAITVCQGL
ncbi:MAG: phosphate acetyltransferase [Fibrobacterota bacterium]